MNIKAIPVKRYGIFAALSLAFLFSSVYGQVEDEVVIKTDLIQTNVIVTDKNGKFIEGLKPEQFILNVDVIPVPVEFFEGKNSVRQNQVPQTQPQQTAPQNREAAPAVSLRERKIIFFIDDVHLSLDSLGRTRSAINHYIDSEMLPRDNVLIITASGQLGFLQQFTDNKSVLRTAVGKLKSIPNIARDNEQPSMPEYIAIRISQGDRSAAEFYVQKIIEGFGIKAVTGINKNAAYEMVKQRANNIVTSMATASDATLAGLQRLLGQINGQKTVFLVSDGFYLESKNGSYGSNTYFLQVLNQATRSGSTVYTIDARGLFSLAPDATNDRPIDVYGALKGQAGESAAAQEGLFALANETGGRFLKNQNYFDKWIDKMLDETSGYYILAWTPQEEKQKDKQFKQIEVEIVGRPDLIVKMPRRYLANWKPETKKTADSKNEKSQNEKNENKIVKIEQKTSLANPAKSLKTKLSLSYLDVPNTGEVLTSSIQVSIDELIFGTDGKQTATIDLGGVIFNSDGKQVADFKTGLNINLPAGDSASQGDQSVIYNDRKVLAPGLYQVQIGVKERQTGMIGKAAQWIEIPDLSKNKLTLGSLFLGAQEIKKADNTSSQVQFSIDHLFNRPLKLSFLTFVYNAAKSEAGSSGANLATQIEIFNSQGRKVVDSPMKPLVIKGHIASARIPVSGAIQQGAIAPGDYLLRVTVIDMQAKATAVQQTLFTVE